MNTERRRLLDVADRLADFAEHLEGSWKVEITDQEIHLVMMSPSTPHGVNVLRLRRQIEAQAPEVVALNDTNVEDPVTGLRKVPDLMVLKEDLLDPSSRAVSSRDLLLVAEVVSPTNPKTDLEEKLTDYPAMGVPFYLVVDPREGRILVHSTPVQGPDGIRYRTTIPYSFGETVPVAQWNLVTTDLVTYPRDV